MSPTLRELLLALAAIVGTVEMMEAGIEILVVEIEIQEVEIVILEDEIVNWAAETEEVVVVVVDCCAEAELAVFLLSSHFATQVHV